MMGPLKLRSKNTGSFQASSAPTLPTKTTQGWMLLRIWSYAT